MTGMAFPGNSIYRIRLSVAPTHNHGPHYAVVGPRAHVSVEGCAGRNAQGGGSADL